MCDRRWYFAMSHFTSLPVCSFIHVRKPKSDPFFFIHCKPISYSWATVKILYTIYLFIYKIYILVYEAPIHNFLLLSLWSGWGKNEKHHFIYYITHICEINRPRSYPRFHLYYILRIHSYNIVIMFIFMRCTCTDFILRCRFWFLFLSGFYFHYYDYYHHGA